MPAVRRDDFAPEVVSIERLNGCQASASDPPAQTARERGAVLSPGASDPAWAEEVDQIAVRITKVERAVAPRQIAWRHDKANREML